MGECGRVWIVVLNWNGREDTLSCLESLQSLDYYDREIVVVDNGSRDGSADAIELAFEGVHVIRNAENLGFSRGNNVGIEFALRHGAEYVLLLNNDTVSVSGDFLSILLERASASGDIGIVTPVITYEGSDVIWYAGGRIGCLTGLCRHEHKGESYGSLDRMEPRETDYASGCCLLVKRKVIEEVGPLDPQYFVYYEDVDWCARARERGYRIEVVPASRIQHRKSSSAGIAGSDRLSETQAYYFARNGLLFARKRLQGWRKASFISGQFTTRLAYNLWCIRNAKGISRYLKGLWRGVHERI